MAEIVLFHHVQGATPGVHAFADALRDGGHTVHVPDLFDGALPESIEAGLALMAGLADHVVAERTARALDGLPADLVYAGFSWGGSIAQRLAQTRPGARGALLYESFVSLSAEWSFGPWPAGLPLQVHGMARDPFFAGEGDLDGARELVAEVGPELAEVFVYDGDAHLFTDASLPSSDPVATALVLERSLELLARIG
ncbi:dienelactone hydrolase [Clavibacter michiganensis]|uniref:dienelactone hydrolase family protein n=1 Tax=Clavibacter michiganensis TaxID=28447 RepID=UPI000CE85D04|nr:dienelactone hydrolase family protein [Clavibacter michiganensis]PPF91166.1 dienelactone hydrolase [Clavibacter michiganensis]PPF99254.1 dienelactone hydrolase [Clavibacter michiganensis]